MYKPSSIMLRQLKRAVKAQRAAREALDDLQHALSSNELNEQMQELLKEEVDDLELNNTHIDLEICEILILALSREAP